MEVHAFCVADGGVSCNPNVFTPSCEGDVLRDCPPDVGFEMLIDCGDFGGTCGDQGKGATCTGS
ncbi:MAG: hypothetical protein IPN01_25865 [Deltaproteobacteria bacterium]|nr:hypothetical protein [Deltaproteobacteria bacterium]